MSGRPGLVDEDRVDLVHDGEVVAPLHHMVEVAGHVVAQVVEAELGVGAVGDVAVVGVLLVLPLRDLGRHPAHREAEELVDLAHPGGVAAGQVVVDRDDVDAIALEGVQVHGQGRDEGFAFTGLHLGDPAEMQRGTAHELDVEVALADGALGRLADDRERLHQEVVQVLAVGQPLPELDRLVGELLVGEGFELWLQSIDVRHEGLKRPQLLALAHTQELGQNAHCAIQGTSRHRDMGPRGGPVLGLTLSSGTCDEGHPSVVLARRAGPARLYSCSRGSSRCLRQAYVTASIREWRWSFSRMLRTWFFTVFSEMNSVLGDVLVALGVRHEAQDLHLPAR